MSNFPTIPEFINTPEEMATALRAIKMSVEILAGLRQGEALGAPQVFVQAVEPAPTRAISYKRGDLWVNTSSNRLYFWAGSLWQIIG